MLNLCKINIESYEQSCLKFACETKDWGGLDTSRFFTTKENGEWEETCDNSHGGFDVSWCFHLSTIEIKERCRAEYNKLLKEEIENTLEQETILNDWSSEETQQYLKWIFESL